MESARPNRRRRFASIMTAGCLAVGALLGLTQGISACSPPKPAAAEQPRPLNAVEADRLARVRVRDYSDGRVGIRGQVGDATKQIRFTGWVDWRQPLLYVRTDARAGMAALLIQAEPGLMAIRSDPHPSATPPPPGTMPPAVAPADNWRVRPLGLPLPDKPDPMDSLVQLLFALAANRPDDPGLLQRTDSRWIRHDSYQGTAVEVLMGPALMPQPVPSASGGVLAPAHNELLAASPTASTSPKASTTPKAGTSPKPGSTPKPGLTSSSPGPNELRAHGGAVAYWVDGQSRLQRLETLLSDTVSARVDFDRSAQPVPVPIAALGGARISPRKVTSVEARALSMMRRRTLSARGGTMSITMPLAPSGMVLAEGWLDWRAGVAYALAHNEDDSKLNALVHAGHTKISLRAAGSLVKPPLPAPRGAWEVRAWEDLGVTAPATDLDVLLHEALSIGLNAADDPKDLLDRAYRLRVDKLDGRTVGVFEIHSPGDRATPAGTALMRYWVDAFGVVHRIELRTRVGFAQLDLAIGSKLPTLPARVA
ncbi:hypothetical protein [Hamadaea tsunoensis]|uniref:hypothetical protein n=1 Tax=Hamadaea tsunoensis TaxID=53368 RepID=UPI00040B424C|nr:hypothetical protein [Hamadaea tsunoensis]